MIKLHIRYLYTEKPGSQFPPAKCAKKHPRKSKVPGNLYFYLKIQKYKNSKQINK